MSLISADRKRKWTHRFGGSERGIRSNKVCTGCRKQFPATAKYFHRNNSAKDGLHLRCKQCQCFAVAKSRKNQETKSQTYCLVDKRGGLLKIGRTIHLKERIKALRVGNQYLTVFVVIDGDYEWGLRKLLDGFRIRGDLFIFNETIGRAIRKFLEEVKDQKQITQINRMNQSSLPFD